MTHHQHTASGTGGYGHSIEGELQQEPMGQQLQAGGQGAQVGGPRDQPGGGIQVGSEFQAGGRGQSPAGSQAAGREMGTSGQSAGREIGIGGQQSGTTVGGPGLALDDALSSPMRVALQDVIEAVRVCEWCADQCVGEGPEMARCVRLCRDVVGLGQLSTSFIIRDSIFGPDVARTFAEAAQECAQECQQHAHEHCQECARVLRRTARTSRELVASVGGQGTTGQQISGQLPAGQQ